MTGEHRSARLSCLPVFVENDVENIVEQKSPGAFDANMSPAVLAAAGTAREWPVTIGRPPARGTSFSMVLFLNSKSPGIPHREPRTRLRHQSDMNGAIRPNHWRDAAAIDR